MTISFNQKKQSLVGRTRWVALMTALLLHPYEKRKSQRSVRQGNRFKLE